MFCRGCQRCAHVLQSPVTHAARLGREVGRGGSAHAAVVVDQRVVTARGGVVSQPEIESLRKSRGRVDDQHGATLRRAYPGRGKLTPVRTTQAEGLRGAGISALRRHAHAAWLSICLQSASMASRRALDLRHTAPTVRVGTGLTNGRMTTPRAWPYAPRPASSGNRVMPTPAATIWRRVSRLVARKSCFSCTPLPEQMSSAWSRRQ